MLKSVTRSVSLSDSVNQSDHSNYGQFLRWCNIAFLWLA